MQPNQESEDNIQKHLGNTCNRLVIRRLDELRPHPSYVKHRISVPAPKLSALAALGELAFLDPIVVTRDRTIVDGYARFELATMQKRGTLNCIEYDLSDLEALSWLVQRHLPSRGYAPIHPNTSCLGYGTLVERKSPSEPTDWWSTKGFVKFDRS